MKATERLNLKLSPVEKSVFQKLAAKMDMPVGTMVKKAIADLARRHGVISLS